MCVYIVYVDDGNADNADGDDDVVDDGNDDAAWFKSIHNIEHTEASDTTEKADEAQHAHTHTAKPKTRTHRPQDARNTQTVVSNQ